MGHIHKVIIAIRMLSLLAAPIATPAAAAGFDGEWNVRIASANASCGNGATVAIDISNGHVASSGAMMKASGRVADQGNISVTLASGLKRAVGSGHLAGTSGSGTWRGPMCWGTWTAQRI
ncbi:hypothetical protein [Bradyrhizobium sp.]|uniref:hypothetical protein n=1 Tax=Bradyrhizobium sp. TaxID=376 RepID=UPI003C5BD161